MLNILCITEEREERTITHYVRSSLFSDARLTFCRDAEEAGDRLCKGQWDCFIFDGALFSPEDLRSAGERIAEKTVPEVIAILFGDVVRKFQRYSWNFDMSFLLKPISKSMLLHRLCCAVRRSGSWEGLKPEEKYKITLLWDRPGRVRNLWNEALHLNISPESDMDTEWVRRKYSECGLEDFPERICPISITILDWDIFFRHTTHNMLIDALEQIIRMYVPEQERAVVFEQYSSTLLVLLNPQQDIQGAELQEVCDKIVSRALFECQIHLFAIYGKCESIDEMNKVIDRLTYRVKNSIAREPGAVPMDAVVSSVESLPDTGRLCDLIVSGQRDAAKNLIREQIFRLPEQFKISSDYIFSYQLRLLQDLFSALGSQNVSAGHVFLKRREFLDMFDVAGRSQLNLINWVYWLTDTVCDKMRVPEAEGSIVERVRRYAEENIAGDLSRGAIAQALHLSESHLSHSFTAYAGVNLTQYLTRLRVEKAKSLLLRTEIPSARIASECGFSSSSYFSRIFLETTGYTPVQYRKLYQKEENK